MFFVPDKPICVPDQKRIYGVARHEDAKIVCKVEAYPPPDSFRWAFNNTEEMVDVPQARYKDSTRHTQSVLTYRPVTEMDYGTVLCWATNTAGQQKNACIFHIIPAGLSLFSLFISFLIFEHLIPLKNYCWDNQICICQKKQDFDLLFL